MLQQDSSVTNAKLAKDVGISPPGMLERVKRLENAGVIRGYHAHVDYKKVGKGTLALVTVSLAVHHLSSIDEFTAAINNLDEVLECYHTAGQDDFMLKVAVKDIQEYEHFVLEKLTRISGVNKINTTFVLSTMKYGTKVNIDLPEEN